MAEEQKIITSFGEKIPFGYGQARREGLTDKDIASYLSQETGYDLDAAYESGLSPTDVITYLADVEDDPTAATSRGLLRGLGQGSGMVTGGMLGAPFGPVGIVGGALTGLIFAEGLNSIFLNDQEYTNVGAEAFGESMGAGIPMVAAPYRLAAQQPLQSTSIFIHDYLKSRGIQPGVRVTPLDKILDTARRSPGSFGAYEVGALTSASTAGALAEQSDPGNTLKRFTAELSGGTILNPANYATLLYNPIKQSITSFISGGREGSRQAKLGAQLVKILEDFGEDPEQVSKALSDLSETELQTRARQLNVEPGKIRSALKAQSPALALINNALIRSKRSSPKAKRAVEQNAQAMSMIADLLVQMDDPEALALASEIQLKNYETTLSSLLDSALSDAMETAARSLSTSEDEGAKAGQIISDSIGRVMTLAREQEKALYKKVDQRDGANPTNIIITFDRIMEREVLPEEPLPSLITKFVGRVSGRDVDQVDDYTKGYNESKDEIKVLQDRATKFAQTAEDWAQKYSHTQPEVENRLMGNFLTRGADDLVKVINEMKEMTNAPWDDLIKELSNTSSRFREKGNFGAEERFGFQYSAIERNRIASYAEKMIDYAQALKKVDDAKIQQIADFRLEQKASGEMAPTFQDMNPFQADPDVTVGDLMKFRSTMLAYTRDSIAAGQYRNAHFYGKMAEAALDDLGLNLEGRVKGTMLTENQQRLKNAFDYSRAFNDVFTRSFAGSVLSKKGTGSDRIPPELLKDKVLGGSVNSTNLNLLQLQDAAEFLVKNVGEEFAETSSKELGTVLAAQETMLRSAVSQFYNPQTDRVNMNGLTGWMNKNDAALSRFPSLKEELGEAVLAQKILKDTTDENSLFQKNLKNQLAFGKFLGEDERPGDVIGTIIGDPNNRTSTPSKNMNALMLASRRAGDNVFKGLRSAIFDHAHAYSGLHKGEGEGSLIAYKDYFTKPLARGKDSLLTIMRKQGMFSDSEATRFNTLLNEMSFIERRLQSGKAEELTPEDVPDSLRDLVVRVIGARTGSQVAQSLGMTGSIQVPGFFAQEARNRFIYMPKKYMGDLLVQAAEDPKLMSLILARGVEGKTNNQKMRLDRRLRAYLFNAGFVPSREEIEENMEEFTFPNVNLGSMAEAAEMPSQQELENYLSSVSNDSPQTAPIKPVPLQPTPPVANPSGTGNNNQRTQYSTVFPNDPIAKLIEERQQGTKAGIGSLFGN
jgi:hypothetical protein